MARKQDYAKGSGAMFSGNTKGSKGIASVRGGIGAQPESGPGDKAPKSVGYPGVADSSLEAGDEQQSAK